MPNKQKRRAEEKREREPRPMARSPRLRMSASKVRRVADTVRGLPVDQALVACDYLPHRAAPHVKETVAAAAANAEENCGFDRELLVVDQIFVEEGFTIPRIRPLAQGRAYRIRKRTSRLIVVLAEREED